MKISCFFIAALFYIKGIHAQSKDTSFHAYGQTIPGTALQIKMVPVPAGKFTMGSNAQDEKRERDETPARTVTVSPFWIGAYEITYDEFDAFMQDESINQNSKVDAITRPSQPYIDFTLGMGRAGGFPANSMQQYGALMFCRWLYGKTGIFYRLPTEAEWEYACRSGGSTVYPFGRDAKELARYAWYKDNSGGHYHKVGELKPNAWGLYDMLGNVGEWTLDQYEADYFTKTADGATDPLVSPTSRHPRTVRGGTYKDDATALRSANRLESDLVWNRRDPQIPKSRWWNADAPFIGFRIIRPLKQPATDEAAAFFKAYLGQ